MTTKTLHLIYILMIYATGSNPVFNNFLVFLVFPND